MNGQNDDLKLKLAWQTAFELRTCPDRNRLYALEPDDNLRRHLAICHVCRAKREMNSEERDAWKTMKEMFATITMKPGIGTKKQSGQIWTLKREYGNWREDGWFSKPPAVLLLEQIEGTTGWRVAQIYHDRQMMGKGDVTLDDQYGFAEAWNCYSLKEDRFEQFLGNAKPEQVKQVVLASLAAVEPAPVGSILSFFRTMEIEVGAFVAVPAVAELVGEWESPQEEVFELIPGLKLAVNGVRDFVLDITAGTLDLIRGTFKPAMVLRGGSTKPAVAKLTDEQKNLIQEHCPVVPVEVKIEDDMLMVTLKWLWEKPVVPPKISLALYGIPVLSAEFINNGLEQVSGRDSRCFNLLVTEKTIIQCKYSANGLELRIE